MPSRGAWGLVGSPNLEAERTVQYEIGVAQQVGMDMVLNLTAFHKDIYNLVGTRLMTALPNSFSTYVTEDYGNVEGVEASFEKKANSWLSGELTYTLSFARGTSSYEREAYYDYIANIPIDPYTGKAFVLPRTVYPLEFDQRHVINANINFNIPKSVRWIGNTNLNLVNQIGSGLPWTERDSRGYLIGETNARRLPWNENTDLKFRKDFNAVGQNFYLFAEITNLFNRKDILSVYETTGKADDNGLLLNYDTYIDQTFPKEYKTVGKILNYSPNGDQHDYPSADSRRDLNKDGYITTGEWYESYMLAYKDILSGYGDAYSNPRKISIGIAFNW